MSQILRLQLLRCECVLFFWFVCDIVTVLDFWRLWELAFWGFNRLRISSDWTRSSRTSLLWNSIKEVDKHSSESFRVGGQRDTVNNPTTWFGPLSHISRKWGPRGTAAAVSGASDTCWPLPSLPDWQMAAPLDENDKWLSVSRKDFLLTSDPRPWLLTPLSGPLTPPSPSLSPGLCDGLSPVHRCRLQVRTKWCGEQLLFLRRRNLSRRKEKKEDGRERGWRGGESLVLLSSERKETERMRTKSERCEEKQEVEALKLSLKPDLLPLISHEFLQPH